MTNAEKNNQAMRRLVTLIIVAAIAFLLGVFAAGYIHADDAYPGTTGSGDRALSSLAMDRNYNCARADSGSCLPDMAAQMGPDANIPAMPSAGEGGASIISREMDRPDVSAEYLSDDQVLSMIGAVLFVLFIFVGGMLIGVSIGKHPRGRR